MSYSTIVLKICSTILNGFADTLEIAATDSLTFPFMLNSGSFGRDSAGRFTTEEVVGTGLPAELVGWEKMGDPPVGAPLSGVGFWKMDEVGFGVEVGVPLSGIEVGWKT